jgi:alkanesulfonate monooxygenase SsuD/methylene tetrahydromethanopterin reductase-like flavin-dependent oxidoreductase (luciferase family)
MEAGVHLPQLALVGGELSPRRILETVSAAQGCGFSAICANDHVVYASPWLDGLAVLAAAVEHAQGMEIMTSIALPVVRGPVPLCSSLVALDLLCGGSLIAGVGPGSSRADYEAVGVPFDQRWARFDEALRVMRGLLGGEPVDEPLTFYSSPSTWSWADSSFRRRVPVWVGSWGSAPGLRRVARRADGWLASSYNTDPTIFRDSLETLQANLTRLGRPHDNFPHALVTMWTWITDRRRDADAAISTVAGVLGREADELRPRVCVGSAEQCIDLLSRYAVAGCRRVHFWPLGREVEQIEKLASDVLPHVPS